MSVPDNETSWEPEPADIAWLKEVIRILTEDGICGLSCSRSIFILHKSKKEYSFAGNKEHEDCKRTFKVFRILGWKIRAMADFKAKG